MDAYSIFPEDVWHNVSECLDPKSLVNLGGVSRVLKEVASNNRPWSKHLKSDYYGLLRTYEHGKDYRLLYRRWRQGRPSAEDLISIFAHRSVQGAYEKGVKAIKLSQAGALVAWSVGADGALLRSDVTTCRTCRWVTPDNDDGYSCLDLLSTDGRVFTGGKKLICWDPRQGESGKISYRPIFKLDYTEATGGNSSSVTTMISEESSGQPRLLTAGDMGDVCLWDLRTNQILKRYAPQGVEFNSVLCLAVEPHHGTLIGGGRDGLLFWNLDTEGPWPTPGVLPPFMDTMVYSIAVGSERMIVGGYNGVFEWALPDPPAGVARQLQGVLAVPRDPLASHPWTGGFSMPSPEPDDPVEGRYVQPWAMQGVGEGPAGILAGTADGSIGMWKCQNNPEMAQQERDYFDSHVLPPPPIVQPLAPPPIVQPPPPIVQHLPPLLQPPPPNVQPVAPEQLQAPVMWSLEPCPFDTNWAVCCLAATDEVVVNGFRNGKVRIARMKQF